MTSNRPLNGEIAVDSEAVHRKGRIATLFVELMAQPMSGPLLALIVITLIFSLTTST